MWAAQQINRGKRCCSRRREAQGKVYAIRGQTRVGLVGVWCIQDEEFSEAKQWELVGENAEGVSGGGCCRRIVRERRSSNWVSMERTLLSRHIDKILDNKLRLMGRMIMDLYALAQGRWSADRKRDRNLSWSLNWVIMVARFREAKLLLMRKWMLLDSNTDSSYSASSVAVTKIPMRILCLYKSEEDPSDAPLDSTEDPGPRDWAIEQPPPNIGDLRRESQNRFTPTELTVDDDESVVMVQDNNHLDEEVVMVLPIQACCSQRKHLGIPD
nr:hypothetical protein Iba_chr09eCG0050 [Ipomoea batatas]